MSLNLFPLVRFSIAVWLAFTVCSLESAAQTDTATLPSSQAHSTDALLSEFDHRGAPGVSVGVYRAGKVLYSRAVGMADLEHDVALTTGSVFNIASMSKQFTAMAVVLLEEDGKLSLDDEIEKFLPQIHSGGKKLTIRQLLQHTSGIRDYLDLMELAGWNPDNRVISQDDILKVVGAQQKLNFDPGDAFRYENTGYALMATVVKRVSGKSLRDFAEERIFRTLDMNSTQFRDDHTSLVKNKACGYEPRDSSWSGVMPIYDEVGDGGVWTTVEDLAKWDANFYQPRVGGERAIRLLLSQATLNDGTRMSYALGLFVADYHGFEMVSHGGVDPGYRSQMLRFPREQLTVAVLANNPAYNVERLARQIADIYLPQSAEQKRIPLGSAVPVGHDRLQLTGRYLDSQTGRIREIVAAEQNLSLRSGSKDYPLTYLGENRFEDLSDGTFLTFETKGAGILQMRMSVEGQMPSVSRRLPGHFQLRNPKAYEGTYSSSELGVAWRIESSDAKLKLKRGSFQEDLSVLDQDMFAGATGLIHFVRDKRGQVTGLTVTNVRDTDIEFQRSSR